MTRHLDLADIQGNILRAFGKQGFACGRFLFFNFSHAEKARAFVGHLRHGVTTATRWPNDDARPRTRMHPKFKDVVRAREEDDYPGETMLTTRPEIAMNLAFSFYGLLKLEVPTRTLRGLPDEFIDGMSARASILGDQDFLPRWDEVWQQNAAKNNVHMMVALYADLEDNGEPKPILAERCAQIEALAKATDGGVTLLAGHGSRREKWQEGRFLLAKQPVSGAMRPIGKEHFGFSDGFGDPVFEGQFPPHFEKLRIRGGGKIMADRSWAPLATGEFLLGHPDEAQETPGASMPLSFSRNGTFTTFRKLHQNVGSFESFLDRAAAQFAGLRQISPEEARETLMAKMAGRWADGVPLSVAPTHADWLAFQRRAAAAQTSGDVKEQEDVADAFVNFQYRDDPQGLKCPIPSHMRRVNTRDMLDPHFGSQNPKDWDGSVLNNRRRILRRGMPYGGGAPGSPRDDKAEQGIVFMAICASLFRQFEFVQQQWLQYGLDFNQGNDTCPLLGNRSASAKFVIPADPATGEAPFICDGLPQLVEPRGGEYFFIPSMTALRMIATGIVDPT